MGIVTTPNPIRQELEALQERADYATWLAQSYQEEAADLEARIAELRRQVEPSHRHRDGICPIPCQNVDDCGKDCPICEGLQVTF